MKKLWQLFILSYMACAIPTMVSAQSLGLNFAATDPDAASSSLNATEVAGVVSQANWNNLTDAAGTGVGSLVYDDAGTSVPSTATVSWNSPNTWRSTANNQFPAGANRKLMTGYLDSNDTAAGGVSITVNNVDAALRSPAYDVYVYFLGDSGENRGGGYTIDDGSGPILKYGSTLAQPSAYIEDPGTDADNSLDGSYLRFTGLTGASFTLISDTTLTTPNGFRAPINAIQLSAVVIPGDVNNDGTVDISDFHIIRANLFESGRTRGQGDLVGDGIVDFADYREWTQNASPGLAASVSLSGAIPEPTSGLLLAMGAALAALVMRRNTLRGAL